MSTKIQCDRCGVLMDAPDNNQLVLYSSKSSQTWQRDMCKRCSDEFINWFDTKPASRQMIVDDR